MSITNALMSYLQRASIKKADNPLVSTEAEYTQSQVDRLNAMTARMTALKKANAAPVVKEPTEPEQSAPNTSIEAVEASILRFMITREQKA